MTPLAALLAALLAFPLSASAQVRSVRVVTPRAAPIVAVPGVAAPAGGLAGTSLSGPSLTATLAPAVPPHVLSAAHLGAAGYALDSAGAAPAGAAPAAMAAVAPAAARLAAAPVAPADAPRVPGAREGEDGGAVLPNGLDAAPRTAQTLRDWLRRYGTADPRETAARLAAAFDGKRTLATDAGAHFQPVPDPKSSTGVRFVRVQVSGEPVPAPRPVPGTEGLAGRALLDAVSRAARQGQRTREYDEASDYMFSTADNITLGGVRGVMDAYSGVFVAGSSPDGRDYPEPGDRNHDGHVDEGMNVEHVWPQGHFDKRLPMRADLHHLMATFIHPNGVRGNMPFGVVRGRPTYKNDAGTKASPELFEPADFSKGRVARAMLYFYSRYRDQNIFSDPRGPRWWDQQIATLLDWNRRFPPDAGERRRNDLVERFQGNRNPFVDDPGLADRIGLDSFRPSSPRARGGRDRGTRESKGFRRGNRHSGRRR